LPTVSKKKTFTLAESKTWNSIPQFVVDSVSANQFEKEWRITSINKDQQTWKPTDLGK